MGEPLLDYSEQLQWHGETETWYLRMTDATFQKHVEAYLKQQGVTEPTFDQRVDARHYCQRISFWEGCTDPDVYIRAIGLNRERK